MKFSDLLGKRKVFPLLSVKSTFSLINEILIFFVILFSIFHLDLFLSFDWHSWLCIGKFSYGIICLIWTVPVYLLIVWLIKFLFHLNQDLVVQNNEYMASEQWPFPKMQKKQRKWWKTTSVLEYGLEPEIKFEDLTSQVSTLLICIPS